MNKQQLKNLSSSTFPTNGVRSIDAVEHRAFNDAAIEAMYTPAGCIMIFPSDVIPTGWHKCDGTQLSKTDYADLFAALGGELSVYGVQNTTFTLPNFQNYATVAQSFIELDGSAQDEPPREINHLGEKGGEVLHTLTIPEMPSHTHQTVTNDGNLGGNYIPLRNGTLGGGGATATGGGQPHNNMPPYILMNYIIKLY